MRHDLCDVQHIRGTGEILNGQAADAGYVSMLTEAGFVSFSHYTWTAEK
jgi:hypothetical protein